MLFILLAHMNILCDVISIVQQDSFANDCCSLLQLVEDTLSTAVTNAFAATLYIIILVCFVLKIQNLDKKVNSPVYSAPLCRRNKTVKRKTGGG